MADPPNDEKDSGRKIVFWGITRVVLGNLQMFGGATTLILVLVSGVTVPAIAVASVTMLSILLFQVKWRK